eukprot:CAMPEP_0119363496 /NCGR_PEP_ID=MMETSP1334-20130426/10407_1 /TAXON_ID=127549 /ORGANISM="Calcidiscus leptoporus, Strain RCC1130" /LENGTH=247 /DNA_ID=CAMNT_0007378967 /DNA_START=57 /DNA_END=797 /DNA_ORIENTATION=-
MNRFCCKRLDLKDELGERPRWRIGSAAAARSGVALSFDALQHRLGRAVLLVHREVARAVDDEEEQRAHRRHALEEEVPLVVRHHIGFDLGPVHARDSVDPVRLLREDVCPERVHVESGTRHHQREEQRAPARLHADDHEHTHAEEQHHEQALDEGRADIVVVHADLDTRRVALHLAEGVVKEDGGDEDPADHLQLVGALLPRLRRLRIAWQREGRRRRLRVELLVGEEDEEAPHDRRRLEDKVPVRL